jgi:predicted nucleic acid binding AN1-type Zn finger protein
MLANSPNLSFIASETSVPSLALKSEIKTRRCGHCPKKLTLTDTTCKCSQRFCMAHRHPESHSCTFDFKGEGQTLLEKQNPKTSGTKIERI